MRHCHTLSNISRPLVRRNRPSHPGAEPSTEEYYRRNPRLFHRDTRVFVRRLVQPFDPKQPGDEAAKRQQMKTWRQQVVDGGNLEKLVQQHGPLTDRRSGGRLKLKEQRPDLHALKKGLLAV